MPSYISEGLHDLSNHIRGGGYFDVIGDREKNAPSVEGSKLFPVDPCSQYVEVGSRKTVTLAESVDIHMDAGGWAVGTIAEVSLEGYCGAIEGSETSRR